MSKKTELTFAEIMSAGKDSLVKGADIHNATHTIKFKAEDLTMPKGVTAESLDLHMNFINQSSEQVSAAVMDIAQDRYEDTKHLAWDGVLEVTPGLTLTGFANLREEVDGEAVFGSMSSLVDYNYGTELTDWITSNQELMAEKAKKLFE
ncbi:hypothetical protein D9_0078 [Aeromonas phage D9]|uniref:Uncharacterized protein n=1 Tax=Aeromonas phage D6 TaxID=2593322 RepID=A0A514TWL0_9CAUD|nr:hypothetical protein PQC08_gp026 [Aeromonas phage D6]QDJ97408.1 hypothetical protein D6_0249 [Aeromonas phage D6]QEP52285.1 hypothetical protein D9_0078 [Aeromonas phage D9]